MATKLTEKQQAKVKEIVVSVNLETAGTAITVAQDTPSIANLKAARKAIAKELHKLDKALAVYDIDLATDEAKMFIETAEAKRLKVAKGR
jgi:hypothetical protein